jgi:prepilin peptidase CpaA
MLEYSALIIFPALMAYAAVSDLLTMTIPNKVSLALVVSFAAFAVLSGLAWDVVLMHVAAGALVLTVCFAMFAFGWIGGGDAKLAAVTALWFEPTQALLYFTYASLLGGLLTLVILQLRTSILPAVLYRMPFVAHLRDPKAGVPYGAAMAPAALIVFPDTLWVAHAAM